MYPWPSILSLLYFFFFYLLLLLSLFFFNTPMCDSSKSWCALGCPSFLSSLSGVVARIGVFLTTHLCSFLFFLFSWLFFYTPTCMCDSSKSWCALGCPSFHVSLSVVVAGVGVPLVTYLLSLFLLLFIHLCGTVAKAGVPLAVHLFL